MDLRRLNQFFRRRFNIPRSVCINYLCNQEAVDSLPKDVIAQVRYQLKAGKLVKVFNVVFNPNIDIVHNHLVELRTIYLINRKKQRQIDINKINAELTKLQYKENTLGNHQIGVGVIFVSADRYFIAGKRKNASGDGELALPGGCLDPLS